jgi:nucleotide-binding universal stress UspA family protein
MEPQGAESSSSPILAAFAPSSGAREPVEFGIAARRFTHGRLVVVAVQGSHSDGDAAALDDLRRELERRGEEAEVKSVVDHHVAHGLARAMEEIQPELVVVGSTRRGKAGSVLLGTTAERVIHESSCPVAIVPNGYQRPDEGVRVVGAAYAPTPEGTAALHAAGVLARAARVRLRVFTVLDPERAAEQSHGLMAAQHHEIDPREEAKARERLDSEASLRAAVAEIGSDLDVDVDVLTQDAADGLVAASRHVDLLVMGSRAYGPRRAVLLGSVSRRVVERAECPVLVLPRDAEMGERLLSSVIANEAG